MKFKALPVTSLEDATVDLEQLQALFTTPGALLPFLQLTSAKQLAVDLGTGSAVFTASASSALIVVSHGLGRAPVFAAASSNTAVGIWFSYSTPTTAHVTFAGFAPSAITGTAAFSWIAVG